jgi:hypothetical protein
MGTCSNQGNGQGSLIRKNIIGTMFCLPGKRETPEREKILSCGSCACGDHAGETVSGLKKEIIFSASWK